MVSSRKPPSSPELQSHEKTHPTIDGEQSKVRRERRGIVAIKTPLSGPICDPTDLGPPLPWGATEEEPEELSLEHGLRLCADQLREHGIWTPNNELKPKMRASLHSVFRRHPHLRLEFEGDLRPSTVSFLAGQSTHLADFDKVCSADISRDVCRDVERISLTLIWLEAENMRLMPAWVAAKALLYMNFQDLYPAGYLVRMLEDQITLERNAIRGETISMAASKGGQQKRREVDAKLALRRSRMADLVAAGKSVSAAARIVAREHSGNADSIRTDYYHWKKRAGRKL